MEPAWGKLVSCSPKHRSHLLRGDVVLLGRRSSCTIRFEEPQVSGLHCELRREASPVGPRCVLVDKSTNGTYVDGTAVAKGEPVQLRPRSMLSLVNPSHNSPVERVAFKFELITPPDEGEALHAAYNVGRTLGTGAFATVKLATHRRTGVEHAVKIIDRKKVALVQHSSASSSASGDDEDPIMGEVQILRQLDHPNIIQVTDVFASDKKLSVVLELVAGGDLFDRLVAVKRFPEERARAIFCQLVDAIAYTHERGVSHRDLKPENILLTPDGVAKISDFGVSRFKEAGRDMQTMVGTPLYLAPEVLDAGNNGGGYGFEVDLWSLGVILFVLLSGTPPFTSAPGRSLDERIRTADFNFSHEAWAAVSDGAKSVIRRLLTPEPARRITAGQLVAHPWVEAANHAWHFAIAPASEPMPPSQPQPDSPPPPPPEASPCVATAPTSIDRVPTVKAASASADAAAADDSESEFVPSSLEPTAPAAAPPVTRKRTREALSADGGAAGAAAGAAAADADDADDDDDDDRKRRLVKIERPICQYGSQCYRKNPAHFTEFYHPHLDRRASGED